MSSDKILEDIQVKTLLSVTFAFLGLFGVLTPRSAAAEAMADASAVASPEAPTVMVFPFVNEGGIKAQDYLSLALATNLAERLEAESGLKTLNGEFPVLTAEQAATRSTVKDAVGYSLTKMMAMNLAQKRGANHFVIGRYRGSEWKWQLEVQLYAIVSGEGLKLVGQGEASGDQTVPVITKSGRRLRIVSTGRLQKMLSDAAQLAFVRAGISLSSATIAAMNAPSTKDSYANILLSRAYACYLQGGKCWAGKSALEIAAHTVRVDPSSVEAQRFLAFLFEGAGKPIKARLHYEIVLAKSPKDVRSLIRLGAIELDARNPGAARNHLSAAVAMRPQDHLPRFWLGKTCLALGDATAALGHFEAARALGPRDMAVRRELVRLYNDKTRYLDAAAELKVITAEEPQNLAAAFELAACLRHGGDKDKALEAYAAAETRFPKEPRFKKYRQSLEDDEGPALGLIADISGSRPMLEGLEEQRRTFQGAANDAAMEFLLYPKESCQDGRGASSAISAKQADAEHEALFMEASETVIRIKKALAAGDGSALPSNLFREAGEILDATKRSVRDRREMLAQYRQVVERLAKRNGCDLGDGSLTAADPEAVQARNLDRRVVLKKHAARPRGTIDISPEVPVKDAKVVHFRVDNTKGKADHLLVLDGEVVAVVPSGVKMDFPARSGTHDLCLVPQGETCEGGSQGRRVFLYEGWSIAIKPSR